MAFGIPSFIFGFIWLIYVPKSSKTKFWAKVFRQDILELASDAGNLIYMRGKTEGPGIFRSHDGKRIDFIPRSAEGWVNKRFHCDKIAHFIGYAGKAIAGNFEMVAVLTVHDLLQEHKNKIRKLVEAEKKRHKGLSESEMEVVLKHFLKTNSEAKELVERLEKAQATIKTAVKIKVKNAEGKDEYKIKQKIKRLSVLLIDPRTLMNHIKDSLQPSQARYVHDIGYQQGVNDTANPLGRHKLLIVALLIIAVVGGVIALLVFGGGTAPPPAT